MACVGAPPGCVLAAGPPARPGWPRRRRCVALKRRWRAWASSNGAPTYDGGRGVRRARGTQAGSEVGRVGANATGGEARARCTRGGGQGELWGSLQGRETVCGGGRRPHPGAAPRRLRGSATPRRRKHLRAKLGCHAVPSFQRAYFEPAADRQVLRGRRTCCPLRVRSCAGGCGAYGGAGEGEQGEQPRLLAACTCGIDAWGGGVGWAAPGAGGAGGRRTWRVNLRHLAASATV